MLKIKRFNSEHEDLQDNAKNKVEIQRIQFQHTVISLDLSFVTQQKLVGRLNDSFTYSDNVVVGCKMNVPTTSSSCESERNVSIISAASKQHKVNSHTVSVSHATRALTLG